MWFEEMLKFYRLQYLDASGYLEIAARIEPLMVTAKSGNYLVLARQSKINDLFTVSFTTVVLVRQNRFWFRFGGDKPHPDAYREQDIALQFFAWLDRLPVAAWTAAGVGENVF